MNSGMLEGFNKYLTGHLGSFNQWGGSAPLHTVLLSVLVSFCVQMCVKGSEARGTCGLPSQVFVRLRSCMCV